MYFLFRFSRHSSWRTNIYLPESTLIVLHCTLNSLDNGGANDIERDPPGTWRMGNTDRHNTPISRYGAVVFSGYFDIQLFFFQLQHLVYLDGLQ